MTGGNLDLEAEYNNRARVPDHPVHIAGWQNDAAAYREQSHGEGDLAYGPEERHRLDLFYPQNGHADGPILLFIHGGYWQSLDKSFFSHMARGANKRGLTVAIPNYRLAPTARLADIISDLEAAANFLMERKGQPLIASGHSAGGHLSACLMAKPTALKQPIKAAMPISGLFDLVPLVPTTINKALGLSAEEAARMSPLRWRAPQEGHMVAVVGGAESSEFLRQSRAIADLWGNSGVTAEYHEVPGTHHFNVIAGLAEPNDPLVDILVGLAKEA
jgi:acetyl esterase/lipase